MDIIDIPDNVIILNYVQIRSMLERTVIVVIIMDKKHSRQIIHDQPKTQAPKCHIQYHIRRSPSGTILSNLYRFVGEQF